jgi:hypothetical protein
MARSSPMPNKYVAKVVFERKRNNYFFENVFFSTKREKNKNKKRKGEQGMAMETEECLLLRGR